jgi:serine/threonine-protein kinase
MNSVAQSGVILNQRYRILRQLGHSGVGFTYLVEDTHRFNEPCVIKELIPQLQGMENLQKTEELFEREAKVLYKLQHSQIPRFRELFRYQSHLFLVEDYIQGQTYHDLLKIRQIQGQTFSESEVIQLLQQILPVLVYIHARGIIHRDISPDNIILRRSDQLAVLIDFGNVKQLSATTVNSGEQPVTVAIATELGEMNYAPPEQIQTGMVYPHSDLYALAATVVMLLTGKDPHQFLNQQDWKQKLALSPKLANLLEKMLAKYPGERLPNAQTVLDILNEVEPEIFPSIPLPENTQATVVIVPERNSSSAKTNHHQPVIIPPSAPVSENSITSSTNLSMASTSSPSRNIFAGCLGKLLIVLSLSLGSGIMGWFAGKAWINQITQNQDNFANVSTSDNSSDNNSGGISDQEWKRKNELQERRLELGLNNQFFYDLVDQFFQKKYPSQVGKTLTNKPEDASWREKWDQIASDLLDQLSFLSAEARQGLGQYNEAKREQWKMEVNQLHLSSRALYDLADATFFYHFPEQENQDFQDKLIGQVWNGFIYDQLQSLQLRENYSEIVVFSEGLETNYQEKLEPGAGKAYVAQLNTAQFLKIELDAPKDVLISVYSPTGRNNLLEDSADHQWLGNLPEDGYYEIVIVSKAKRTIDYQLNFKVSNNEVITPNN